MDARDKLDTHQFAATVQTFGLLSEALPQRFTTSHPWRFGWSNKAFWQCRVIKEILPTHYFHTKTEEITYTCAQNLNRFPDSSQKMTIVMLLKKALKLEGLNAFFTYSRHSELLTRSPVFGSKTQF